MAEKKWIQGATEPGHEGKLRQRAEHDHAIQENGNIDLAKMERIAEEENDTQLKREVSLAKTLRRFDREKERPSWDVNYSERESSRDGQRRYVRAHTHTHSRGHHGGPCDASCRRAERSHHHRR